jgi:hypothetical protein
MGFSKLVIFLLASLLALNSGWCDSKRPSAKIVAAMGDSLTAAFFADTKHPVSLLPSQAKEVLSHGTVLVPQLQFLGEPPQFLTSPNNFSWATGAQSNSHAQRVSACLNEPLKTLNVAKVGAKTDQLSAQAMKIRKAVLADPSVIEYVTLFAGANDLCGRKGKDRNLDLTLVRTNILNALGVLNTLKQEQRVKILLVGVPAVASLRFAEISEAVVWGGAKCGLVRDQILNSCPSLIEWNTPAEYQGAVEEIQNFNRLLMDIVDRQAHLFPNLALAYADSASSERVPVEDLASDCFHYNVSGQRKLAEWTWSQQPWFKGCAK